MSKMFIIYLTPTVVQTLVLVSLFKNINFNRTVLNCSLNLRKQNLSFSVIYFLVIDISKIYEIYRTFKKILHTSLFCYKTFKKTNTFIVILA